jgi:hypothetical protein
MAPPPCASRNQFGRTRARIGAVSAGAGVTGWRPSQTKLGGGVSPGGGATGFAATAAFGEELLDDTILKRMKRHDDETTAFGEKPFRAKQPLQQFLKLVVYGDAQSLEASGRRMNVAGAIGSDARDHFGQRSCRCERRNLTVVDDGAGDTPRGTLLAVEIQDVGERLYIRFIDDVGGAAPSPSMRISSGPSARKKNRAAVGCIDETPMSRNAVKRREACARATSSS